MAKQFGPGDQFPNYTIADRRRPYIEYSRPILNGEYAVILFYRGIW